MTVASAWQFTDGIQVIKYLMANFVCSYMYMTLIYFRLMQILLDLPFLTMGLHLNYAVAPDLATVLNYYLF